MTDVLLLEYLLVAQVAQAAATKLLIGPHQQKALCTGLKVSLAVDETLLAPAIDMWANFLLHEAPDRVAELLMFWLEDASWKTHVQPPQPRRPGASPSPRPMISFMISLAPA
ncbi:hypothetical protein D3C80_1493820 [compost metagenome]